MSLQVEESALPVILTDSATGPGGKRRHAARGRWMSKVLIVDDSRAIRSILGKILARNGFEVCQAGNGVEALQALTSNASDISLLCADYNMPEMNGIELLQNMRAMPQFASVPVLMITTETHMASMQAAFAAGANEYVMKPFTADMIEDKLRMLGVLAG
jgi:two-component system chemotaxis response regulator CheY